MAINLATKYSKKVDERFKLGSLTEAFVNHNYDWEGVDTVKVYSIPTVAMGDYKRTGKDRYGTPTELEDNVQTMKVAKDRSFTYTIDKGNKQDSMNVRDAGKSLRRQIDEVITPEKDAYRLDTMIKAAVKNKGTNTAPKALTKATVYTEFLNGQVFLDEKKVPRKGRIAAVTPQVYALLKQDPLFVKNADLGQKITINGQVGEVDGVKIVMMPSSYLTKGCGFLIAHPAATVAVEKLEDYKIHKDPPGINGNLVEGRTIYDAFIMDSKKDALYAYQESSIATE